MLEMQPLPFATDRERRPSATGVPRPCVHLDWGPAPAQIDILDRRADVVSVPCILSLQNGEVCRLKEVQDLPVPVCKWSPELCRSDRC